MNNFTPEYTELCKDKRVQGLREILLFGDKYCLKNGKNIDVMGKFMEIDKQIRKQAYLWLPTGDQLDEEIVRISKGLLDGYYAVTFDTDSGYDYWDISLTNYSRIITYEFRHDNPLIAKLNLLIKLLEEK